MCLSFSLSFHSNAELEAVHLRLEDVCHQDVRGITECLGQRLLPVCRTYDIVAQRRSCLTRSFRLSSLSSATSMSCGVPFCNHESA
jgi:hypothetical protein